MDAMKKTHLLTGLLAVAPACLLAPVPGGGGSSDTTGAVSTTVDGNEATSSPEAADTGPATTTASSTMTSSGSMGGTSESGDDPHENGYYPCLSDADCISGNCFEYAGQGMCGECDEDSDCESGFACAPPNPGVFPYEPPFCDNGGLGSACSDDSQCLGGRTCRHILDIPNVYDFWTCADCESDADCAPPLVCSQTIVLTQVNGWYECVLPSSIALGAPCDLLGNGDDTCESGACAAAAVTKGVDIGICSECDEDLDCGAGAHCVGPVIDAAEVTSAAGYCEPDA